MNRHIGKFYINADYVTKYSSDVKRIMGKCTILKAEYRIELNSFKYTAICDHFDVCEEGEIPPTYKAIIEEGQPVFKRLPHY